MTADSRSSLPLPQHAIKHERPRGSRTRQGLAPPSVPDKERTQPSREKVDIPNLRSSSIDHAPNQIRALHDSKKSSNTSVPVNPHPHRPFSPSALASKSGKTIKAFFRHRHSDSLPIIISADTLGEENTDPSPPHRRKSTQAKKHEVIEPPKLSGKESAAQPPNASSMLNKGQHDHHRSVHKASDAKVQFPKTEEEGPSSADNINEEPPLRKPRLSLSFFLSAMKTKPVTKIVAPLPAGNFQDARIPPDTIRRHRPVSSPASKVWSSSSDLPLDDRRPSIKPDKPRPLSRGLPSAKGSIDALVSETPPVQSKQVTALTGTKQRPAPVKDIRPSAEALDPKPPDCLETDVSSNLRLLPLTSPQSATTSITVNLDSTPDPDREDHYLLRMACTYLTKTILPEVKMTGKEGGRQADPSLSSSTSNSAAIRTASEKADALRTHVYDKIKLMERMEKAWGIEWMLRGKEGFVVSDARKERERGTFRRTIDDGVVLCL